MVELNGVDPTRDLPELARPAVDSIPGLARVAASAAIHTGEWGAKTTVRSWMRVGKALTQPSEGRKLIRDAGRMVGVAGDTARALSSGTPVAQALLTAGESLGGIVEQAYHGTEPTSVNGTVWAPDRNAPEPTLRERGADLLARSRDVWSERVNHPAYERILTELAPDEARVLLLLLEQGPQPSVDVRTGGPVGMVSSQLVAPGLQMIGPRAGCRWLEEVPAYLNNLHRLGLVWFSREALKDPMEYQVLEAQPDVLDAMHSVKFAKVVRRSIHLTPFGEGFCRACLVDEETAGSVEFPEHAAPEEESASE